LFGSASPLDTVPWALLVWIAAGIAWSIVVAARRPMPDVEITPVSAPALIQDPALSGEPN